MDPAALIPTPDAIPVPWGWFQFLLLLTFYLHLLFMNVMLGTVIIAFTHHFRCPDSSGMLTREISHKLPFSIALTVNFGVAPLLFIQVLYGHFIYASSVLMAPLWLSIIGILIAAYYTAYIYRYRYDKMTDSRVAATGLISCLLLLIGFFFSNNFTLMLHPEAWPSYFDHPTAMLLNFSDPTLVPRYLHFVFASMAVSGLAIALYFHLRQKNGSEQTTTWIRYGCNWFGYATFANFTVGFWLFGSLPQGLINPTSLVGGLFSFFLVIGISTALLAAIYSLRFRVMPALSRILGSIFSMILVREFLRVAYLAPYFSLTDLKIATAYSPLILFLLFFASGLVLIGWMLKTTWKTYQKKEVQP